MTPVIFMSWFDRGYKAQQAVLQGQPPVVALQSDGHGGPPLHCLRAWRRPCF